MTGTTVPSASPTRRFMLPYVNNVVDSAVSMDRTIICVAYAVVVRARFDLVPY